MSWMIYDVNGLLCVKYYMYVCVIKFILYEKSFNY